MRADGHSVLRGRRGFVIGELLVAVLLLAVAVSSLAALMYSVSHRSEMAERVACSARSGGAPGQCAQPSAVGGPQLLRSNCVVKNGVVARGCAAPPVSRDASGETIVKTKTDSASLALVAKKEKPAPVRHNRGFVR